MNQLASSRVAQSRVSCFKPVHARRARRSHVKVLAQQTGKRWDNEAETAAQVRRLIRRDKKEFLGAEDILQRFEAEFGEGTSPAQSGTTSTEDAAVNSAAGVDAESRGESAASTSAPARSSLASRAAAVAAQQSGAPTTTRFKGSTPASPFGGASVTSSPFGTPPPAAGRNKMEPQGLSPSMSPDPIQPEQKTTLGSFISGITLTQIVIVLSFSTIIGLMVATFTFVYNVGAIKLAGVD